MEAFFHVSAPIKVRKSSVLQVNAKVEDSRRNQSKYAKDIDTALAANTNMGMAYDAARLKRRMNRVRIQSARSIGTTSHVFRLDFASGGKVAFKIPSDQRPNGHKSEIAAYMIGELLRMDQIPTAIPFAIGKEYLEQVLVQGNTDFPIQRHTNPESDLNKTSVDGAAMEWIPHLTNLGLEENEQEWLTWLQQGIEIPTSKKVLARDLSEMLVFDYLIGNGDRFSGGNMKGIDGGARLVIRDHDLAFPSKEKKGFHRKLFLEKLAKISRFSKRQLVGLMGMDEQNLRAQFSRLNKNAQLLSRGQIENIFERKKVILSYVTARSDELGHDNVYYF